MESSQCWCSKIDCLMHNKIMSNEDNNRIVFPYDKNLDCCARGELGLFCDARYISDELKEKINKMQ